MKYLFLVFMSLLFVGCRGSIHSIGTIGAYTVYSGKVPSAAGPSMNFVALQRDTNEVPVIVGISSGNGISTTVLQAGGIIGAATLLKPSTIENNYNQPASSGPTPPMIGPPLPPTTIGNDKNDRPFTHRK